MKQFNFFVSDNIDIYIVLTIHNKVIWAKIIKFHLDQI